ncbi:DNA-processing protein DprA [Pseudanabaena sp. FACHB-2040]|uniref:DNA-processing protein DprA n=1 Tax=Pseudanabaena sp. FACHB-2040 TaxID=2692859 RepID=UPI001683A050|nr:DNA-processing protein DprA [Pseudanabaena sp. FACHB-2040]MBD2259959.1 DNA-protecting protein DprA [Pseudanabaena sp. FACHB-2040]
MANERAYWLAWSRLKGVGPVLQKRIYEHFGSLAIAWSAAAEALQQVDGLGPALVGSIVRQRSHLNPEALLATHEEQSPAFWTPTDLGYPALLLAIPDPPPLLYYRGRPELMAALEVGVGVGIVGTRNPSDYGRRWTRRLTCNLVKNGVIIVSGLAEGVDREAHLSTLETGGNTIAVLGTGVDVAYPWSNRALYDRIEQEGLLVSEYPNGTPPDRPHFPRRNRIIAGLSRAVLVTEAPLRSGALITARLANDYGREVYALPGSLDNARCLGCLGLINEGAHLVLEDETLLKGLGTLPATNGPASVLGPISLPAPDPALDPLLQQVLQAVTLEPVKVDHLAQQVPIPPGSLLGALVQLELLGLVVQLPGTQYRRC